MPNARDLRRCALQAMYQLDAQGVETPEEDTLDVIRQSLEHASGGERTRADGLTLALAAWAVRAEADAAVAGLAPDWPTHRQPVVDRNILRLACYEMNAGDTPPKVAINEAVELAKEFSTEKSPLFVNGVLDRIYRIMRGEVDPAATVETPLADPVADPIADPVADPVANPVANPIAAPGRGDIDASAPADADDTPSDAVS